MSITDLLATAVYFCIHSTFLSKSPGSFLLLLLAGARLRGTVLAQAALSRQSLHHILPSRMSAKAFFRRQAYLH